jgi:hypothetical protein
MQMKPIVVINPSPVMYGKVEIENIKKANFKSGQLEKIRFFYLRTY